VTTQNEAETAVEVTCRYIRGLEPTLAVLEGMPVTEIGVTGTLAYVAGVAQLLSERALRAYGLVREARGLAALMGAFPDTLLLAEIADRFEGTGGGDPGDLG
jgi:hypothetical protein